MIHLGDITKISGYDAPVVDCVIGGSPCQDLSIAGKRAGLAGERSGLYMEQIRTIKEMRERDRASGRTGEFIRPRYMVWENVPGAFSSNKGQDFAAVLEETVRIVEPEAPSIPAPEKGWPTSGAIVGDGWSVAYRVLDAQFWGVPQRRRRIALVADFGGRSAPEILFVREGLHGHTEPCGAEGQRPTRSPEMCADRAICLQGNGIDRADTAGCNGKGWTNDVSYTLNTIDRHAVLDMTHANDVIRECGNTVPTLQSRMGTGGNQVPLVYGCPSNDCAGTLDASYYKGTGMRNGLEREIVYTSGQYGEYKQGCGTLRAAGGDYGGGSENLVVRNRVRRLTPMECERLQGFPDNWTNIGTWVDSKGKKHETSDAARYKALGNSIALPPWKWVLKRLCAQYERDATMASLFDGIGGFPKIWEQLNGEGSCLWASEIEPFCVAVTERRFKNG